jgi:alkylated DNA nucleotide flippase Atl1
VVNKEGRLAPSYAFGGYHEQRNRLLSEGTKFIDELHVDMEKCHCRD